MFCAGSSSDAAAYFPLMYVCVDFVRDSSCTHEVKVFTQLIVSSSTIRSEWVPRDLDFSRLFPKVNQMDIERETVMNCFHVISTNGNKVVIENITSNSNVRSKTLCRCKNYQQIKWGEK